MALFGSQLSSDSIQFDHNVALTSGGSVFAADASNATITRGYCSNSCAGAGGCIAASQSALAVSLVFMEGSEAGYCYKMGAGFTHSTPSWFTAPRVPQVSRGGAILVIGGSGLIRNQNMVDSTAAVGGALYVKDSSLQVVNVLLQHHIATSWGGALACLDSDLVLRGATLHTNVAVRAGGGLAAHGCGLSVNETLFIENGVGKPEDMTSKYMATLLLSGKYVGVTPSEAETMAAVTGGSAMVAASATRGGGALVVAWSEGGSDNSTNQTVELAGCTFVRNSAQEGGGVALLLDPDVSACEAPPRGALDCIQQAQPAHAPVFMDVADDNNNGTAGTRFQNNSALAGRGADVFWLNRRPNGLPQACTAARGPLSPACNVLVASGPVAVRPASRERAQQVVAAAASPGTEGGNSSESGLPATIASGEPWPLVVTALVDWYGHLVTATGAWSVAAAVPSCPAENSTSPCSHASAALAAFCASPNAAATALQGSVSALVGSPGVLVDGAAVGASINATVVQTSHPIAALAAASDLRLQAQPGVTVPLCFTVPTVGLEPLLHTTQVELCKPGHEPASGSSQGGTGCAVCARGYVSSDGSKCTPCQPGRYQPQAGKQQCLQPRPGYVVDHVAGIAQEECQPGTYANANATACASCATGTYQPSSGTTACISPPLGYVVATNTSAEPCAAGSFKVSDTLCQPCAVGRYQSLPAQLQCNVPPGGSVVSVPGSKTFAECGVGTYAVPNATECLPCPAGKYAAQAGHRECQVPQPGHYVVSPSAALPCPEGRYQTSATSCGVCDPGTISARAGATKCEPCPVGQFSASRTECALCPDGSYANPARDDCIRCPTQGVTCTQGLVVAEAGWVRQLTVSAAMCSTNARYREVVSLCFRSGCLRKRPGRRQARPLQSWRSWDSYRPTLCSINARPGLAWWPPTAACGAPAAAPGRCVPFAYPTTPSMAMPASAVAPKAPTGCSSSCSSCWCWEEVLWLCTLHRLLGNHDTSRTCAIYSFDAGIEPRPSGSGQEWDTACW